MKLKIEITMDNAIFGDEGTTDCAREVSRILEVLVYHLRFSDMKSGYSEVLRAINGDRVGTAKVTR